MNEEREILQLQRERERLAGIVAKCEQGREGRAALPAEELEEALAAEEAIRQIDDKVSELSTRIR